METETDQPSSSTASTATGGAKPPAWRGVLTQYGRPLLLAVMIFTTLFFPDRKVGIYGFGLVSGASLALLAVAVVLTYRSDRILNFAQAGIVAASTTLFTVLTGTDEPGSRTGYFPMARVINVACDPCIREAPDEEHLFVLGGILLVGNFILAAVLAIGLGVLLGLVLQLVVRRLNNAPRLLVTVATMFASSAFTALAAEFPRRLITDEQRRAEGGLNPATPPWNFSFEVDAVRFELSSVVTVVTAVLAIGLVTLYMARSRSGAAIRAAAENATRAASLGLNVGSIGRRVWMLSGLLGGVTGVLLAMEAGVGESQGALLQVRILAAALVGGFSSLLLAAAAAVVIGLFEQMAQYSFGSTAVLDIALLVVIGASLFLQRQRSGRSDLDQAGSWRAEREIRPIPRELRSLPVVRSWIRTLVVVGLIVLLGLPWILSAAQATLATIYIIYAMVGLSLLVLTGWAGQISLGQFGFAAVGAYFTALLGLPFPLSLLAAAVVGGLAALLVGIPAMRLRGLHLAVVTLAFAVAVSSVLLSPRYLGKHLPGRLRPPVLVGFDLEDQRAFYYFSLVMLVLLALAVLGMRKSRTARMLIACRDNEQAAQSFGISLVRARLSAFAASGAIAAIAGGLFAYSQGGVRPEPFGADQSINLFLWSVIGGFGSIAGPLLGVGYFGFLALLGNNPIANYLGGGLGAAGGFLLLLLVAGGGLSQLVFKIRDNLLRRVANRYGLVVPSLMADMDVTGLNREAAILPKMRPGGGEAFVPRRYALSRQWGVGQKVPVGSSEDDRENEEALNG